MHMHKKGKNMKMNNFIETLKQFENADINSLKAFITSTSEEIYE